MGTITEKLQKLLSTRDAIKAAIIGKGQTVDDTDTFASYADKIAAIETGVDTSDATAAAYDIASGKTAYVNGEKVTGTIIENATGNMVLHGTPASGSIGDVPAILVKSQITSTILGRAGKEVDIFSPASNFGDATAADVAYGKTFTSEAGLKVSGNVPVFESGIAQIMPSSNVYGDTSVIGVTGTFTNNRVFRSGSEITLTTSPAYFGNATAADVASGKTFTSVAGHQVLGTASLNTTKSSVTIINYTQSDNLYVAYMSSPTSWNLGVVGYNERSTFSCMLNSIIYVHTDPDTTLMIYSVSGAQTLCPGDSRAAFITSTTASFRVTE